MTHPFSEKHLENIKHVLFGNQRQANSINEGVSLLVATSLSTIVNVSTSNTTDDIVKAISDAFNLYIKGRPCVFSDSVFIMVVGGELSLDNIKNHIAENLTLSVTQPNPNSDKHVFMVIKDGDDVSNSYSDKSVPTSKASVDPDHVYNEDDDFQTRADKIRDAILEITPTAVKEEVADPYAQALCVAEWYYGYK